MDTHVAKHIFQNCIQGSLKHKTRVLVTHQLQYTPFVDKIVVIKEGNISEVGTFQSLMDSQSEFYSLYTTHISGKQDHSSLKDSQSIPSQDKIDSGSNPLEQSELKTTNNSKLIVEEDREIGKVSWEVWRDYISAIGGLGLGFFILSLYIINSSLGVIDGFWLSFWSSNPELHSLGFYLGIYASLNLVYAVLVVVNSTAFSFGSLNSSKVFHSRMLVSILHAPMSFFDTTPIGRVLNRFSKDQYTIDVDLSGTLEYWIATLFYLFQVVVVMGFIIPLLLVFMLPLSYIYRLIHKFYVSSSRELKRLDSISKSPINAQFSETLHGLSTIRAFQRQNEFIKENYYRLNQNLIAYHCWQTANRWLGLRLEFIGACVVTLCGLFVLLERTTLSSGLVGLILTYGLQVTSGLEEFVRMFVSAENEMVAVERVSSYIRVEQEPPSIIPSSRPSSIILKINFFPFGF